MGRDRALEYVHVALRCPLSGQSELCFLIALCRPIPADGEALVDEYNAELGRLEERGLNTWFTAPWLYAEYALAYSPDVHSHTFTGVTCKLSGAPYMRTGR